MGAAPALAGAALDADAAANRAIREVASTPSADHVIPAAVVAFLYEHVDHMRAEFFAGRLPEVVLSFDVTDRRVLAHYTIRRNGMGVRWVVNVNPVHLARPAYAVLATLAHAHQHAWGTPGKPPHHNKEFRDLVERLGTPTNERGHYLGVRAGSRFEAYCARHGVPFAPTQAEGGGEASPPPEALPPLLPAPPARPSGSRLRLWTCPCGVKARVAGPSFEATCDRCGGHFGLAG